MALHRAAPCRRPAVVDDPLVPRNAYVVAPAPAEHLEPPLTALV